MKSIALSGLLSSVALASSLTPEQNYCEPKVVYETVYAQPSSTPVSTSASAEPTGVVLSPAVPSHINKYSLQHVAPVTDKPTNLYFESKNDNQVGYSAVAKASFNAPSVVIDHCGYAKTVYSNGQLVVSFSYPAAYNAAKNQWGGLDKMYIMTHTPGCGNYENGEHCFFSATEFSYDENTNTITCSGEAKDVNDAVDGYQVDFGHGDQLSYYGSGDSTGEGVNSTGNGTTGSGNSIGGNSTYTANLTSACNAPVDTKYNLPTACLGPYFDSDIDDKIGYENGNQSSWASKVPSSINALDADGYEENGNATLKKRFTNPIAFLQKKVVAPVVQKAKQFVEQKIIPAIDKLSTFNIGERTFAFSAPKSQNVDKGAPWPNARLLYKGVPNELSKNKKIGTVKGKEVNAGVALESSLNIYCVDCGVKGKLKYSGSVKVGTGLIEYIILDTEMDLAVSMYAGLSGNISATIPGFSADIVSVPITPLTIPPFVDLGPSLSVGIDMNLKIGLENAQVLAGGTLVWKGAKSHMAYKSGQSSASNWTPQFQPTFNASGELSLALDFGLPIELLLGVKLASQKKLGAGFAIEARPALEAKASVEGSVSKTAGSSAKTTIGDETCNFIKTGIDLKFESGLSFKATDSAKFVLKKFPDLTRPLAKGCLSKTDAGLSFKSLPLNSRGLIGRQTNATISSNDTLWYLNTTQLTNITLEELADDPVEDFALPAIASTAYNDTNGLEYVSLYDASEEFLLAGCGDGNLYMQLNENLTSLDAQGCGTLFAYDSESDIIYADGAAQLFYYYPEEMNATGVSRLRHSAIDSVPINAEYVFFEPLDVQDDDSTGDLPSSPIYVATTAEGSYYGTAVCLFSNETMPPKFFLVQDPEQGPEMLMSPDIKYSITGGDVTDCFYLPLSQGNDEPDDAWNGVADDLDWDEDWVEDWVFDDEVLSDDEFDLSNDEIDEFVEDLE